MVLVPDAIVVPKWDNQVRMMHHTLGSHLLVFADGNA